MISSLMWGFVLLLAGLALIIKTLFGISIPLMRIGLGVLLTYAGINLLTHPGNRNLKANKQTISFCTESLNIDQPKDVYDVVLGQATLDLRNITLNPGKTCKININTILGISHVLIDPKIPTRIEVNSTASNVQLPNETTITFGSRIYETNHSMIPTLEINAQAIMGSLIIETS